MEEQFLRMDRTHILNMIWLTKYTTKDMREDEGRDGESQK
jgi:hypothetical protein